MTKSPFPLPRSLLMWAVLCSAWFSAASAALAAGEEAQARKARKACLSGDYEKGVSILSDLFVDTKDPTYIFNQARCFEQNRRYEDAIARFQEYLRAAPDLPNADKELTNKHIADCQAILDKQAERMAQAAPAAAPPAHAATLAPQAPPEPAANPYPDTAPAEVVRQAAPSEPGSLPGRGLRVAGIATAAVGVAGIVTGVILNLKVNSMADDLESYGNYSSSKESRRKTYETLGWSSYGVGAACAAAGAVLYYLGRRAANRSSSSLAIVPMLAPGHGGAALAGAF